MTDDGRPRERSAKHIGELAILRELGAVPEMAKWTDEQWAAHDAEIQRRAVAELPARPKHNLETYGWPKRVCRDALAADLEMPATKRMLATDVRERNVVVLVGPRGCGKTVAAACWALTREAPPLFIRAASFAARGRYDEEQRSEWTNARALVLDDLGVEYADEKGSFLTDLDELIDTYHGAMKPLIITTNATLADFTDRYKARIVDRLAQSSTWITVNTPSLRRA